MRKFNILWRAGLRSQTLFWHSLMCRPAFANTVSHVRNAGLHNFYPKFINPSLINLLNRQNFIYLTQKVHMDFPNDLICILNQGWAVSLIHVSTILKIRYFCIEYQYQDTFFKSIMYQYQRYILECIGSILSCTFENPVKIRYICEHRLFYDWRIIWKAFAFAELTIKFFFVVTCSWRNNSCLLPSVAILEACRWICLGRSCRRNNVYTVNMHLKKSTFFEKYLVSCILEFEPRYSIKYRVSRYII